MQKSKNNKLILHDGSRIGVVGGGPAGSFFSYFAFELAEKAGFSIEIDIYEPKDFSKAGPPGCNHCGGIVAESLVHLLKADGISLPAEVIRTAIETYTLHLEQGTAVIENLGQFQRIISMFRGSGPLDPDGSSHQGFDGYMLDLCRAKGAKLLVEKVTGVEREPDGITLVTHNFRRKYDLVVGAVGLDPKTLSVFRKLIPGFVPPQTAKAYISEFYLGHELVSQHFGTSMHVFVLDLPGIKFGALIPKGNYVTLVLLGSGITTSLADSFINSKTVRDCFPEGIMPKPINPCMCFPLISIKNARNPYSDRVVLIGDSSSSKIYKNGIGAAYLTGKAAAETVINQGISFQDFRKSFQPVCSSLDRDNSAGKLIFFITTIVQKSSFLKKVFFQMVVKEQSKEKGKREMSLLLWDTFTGSAPYKNIFLRSLNPLLLLRLIWNIISVFVASAKFRRSSGPIL